jgi:hypothetical protein
MVKHRLSDYGLVSNQFISIKSRKEYFMRTKQWGNVEFDFNTLFDVLNKAFTESGLR